MYIYIPFALKWKEKLLPCFFFCTFGPIKNGSVVSGEDKRRCCWLEN